jgi:hypothetical protein
MPLRRAGDKEHRATRRLSSALAEAGRSFYSRGWVLGTGGNFSGALQREPVRLLITASGIDKSVLGSQHFLEIDEHCKVVHGVGKPSAEAQLHLAVARVRRRNSSHTFGMEHSCPTFTPHKAVSPSRAMKCSKVSKE